MSTTPIAVVYNGATVNITAPVANLTAAALIALIPTSFYGGVAVRLTTQTAPTVLIPPATNLVTTYITVGTLYTFNLVAVARYSLTNSNDTNPLTNVCNVDYLPGTTYIAGSVPTRQTLISDTVAAFNVLLTAQSLSNLAAANTPLVSNDSAAGWYGFYTTSSTNIISSNFIAAGTYLFSPVVHYTIQVPHGSKVIAEYLTNQTAGVLISASGVPANTNPFPGLFVNDGSATDSNVKTKLIASTASVSPLASACSYIVDIVNQYTIVTPAVAAGTITPIFNSPYPLSQVSSANLATYAVLGGTGVTNTTGATVVTGAFGADNAGSQVVTLTAGTITANGNAVSAGTTSASSTTIAAHNEAVNLRAYLLKLTPGGVTLPATNAGSTFTAGIYYGAGAVTFSGTLTLDAQGNPNAMFIFGSASGTMAFGSTTIALANGAQAGNVWFMAPAAVTMSGATLFGNIITNGAITDSGSSTITGRLISTAGLITTNTSTIALSAVPGTTLTVAAASAVTTVIDTLEFQTPLYLMTQMSVSTTANALTDANGNILNLNLPITNPMSALTLTPIVTFTVNNNGTLLTVRGTWTETVAQMLMDPVLYPSLGVGVSAGKQVTLYRDLGYTLPLSPALQLQNVQNAIIYTNPANALTYNSITVNMPGSSLPAMTMNFANDATYGDTYTNVRMAAMLYFGNVSDTSSLKYCLFNATVTSGASSTISQAYGPFSTNNTAVSATQIAASDPVVFNLETLTAGQLAVTGGTTGTAYFPTRYTVDDTIKYLAASAAQGMSVIAGSPPANVWVLFSGSSNPYLPFKKVADVAPTFNLAARQDTTMILDLITDSLGTYTLVNISELFASDDFIAWTQYLFPALASATLTACTKSSSGVVPVFSVLPTNTVYPSPAAATTTTHNKLYMKNSVEVIMIPPSTIARPNIDTMLPTSFTMYDLLNYAKTNLGLTSLLSYAMYPVADSGKNVLGPVDTVASIISEFNISGAASFQIVPASYAQVTVVYNSTTTVLPSMPVASLISEVLVAATSTLNIQSPTVLELVSTTILLTDPISKWATAPATTGGLYTLTLQLQTQVKANVVIYSPNGFVEFNKKESMNMTVAQLIAVFAANQKLSPATAVTLTALTTSTVAAGTDVIGLYSRSLATAADTANLDTTDPTPVSKVIEFSAQEVVQTVTLSVQNLFNIGAAASLTVPAFSTAATVAAAAVQQFGYGTSSPTATFGLALAGTSTALSPTSTTAASSTYVLVETTSPRQWASVTIGYTDQTGVAPKVQLVLASTVLSALAGFDKRMDVLSLSNGGTSLSPYTQTVASIMPASGVLQLYDSTLPNVSVTVNLNGTTKVISVSPRSKMSDVLTALSVTQAVVITEVSSGKTAALTDLLVSFTSPYSFNIVNAPTLYTVTLTYGTQTATEKYANGVTVAKILADAVTAFSLDATKTYNLAITGQSAVLATTATPDLTANTAFTVTLSGGLDSNTLIALGAGGGLGLLALLLIIFQ